MKPAPPESHDLRIEREAIQHGLARTNRAGLLIVLVVLALALGAGVLAFRSMRHARDAAQERNLAEERLFHASLAQARAQRLAGQFGTREHILDALEAAAKLRPSLELRNEVIAALALTDFSEEPIEQLLPEDALRVAMDGALTRVAVASADGALTVQELGNEKPLFSMTNGAPVVRQLALSGDGRYLGGVFDKQLKVWEISSAKILVQVPAQFRDGKNHLVFSSGQPVAAYSRSARKLAIHHLEDEEVLEIATDVSCTPLAMHSNLLAVATGSRAIRLYTADGGQLVRELPPFAKMPTSATWSEDGRWLVVATEGMRLETVDLNTGRSHGWQAHNREGVRGFLRPQGDLLVSYASDATLRVWDAVSGLETLRKSGLEPVGFSQDGERFAAWSIAEGLKIFRVRASDVYQTIKVPPGHSVWCGDWLAFSPDGTKLVATVPSGLWQWNIGTSNHVFEQVGSGGSWGIKFDGNKRLLGFGRGRLMEWRWQDKQAPTETNLAWRGTETLGFDDQHDNKALVWFNRGAVIFDVATGNRELFLQGHATVSGFQFSPDGQWVTSGTFSSDASAWTETYVWSAKTGERVATFPVAKSFACFSPDSQLVVIGTPTEYKFVQVGTWKVSYSYPRASSGGSSFGAFSKDLFALQSDARTVALFSPHSRAEVAQLQSPTPRSLRRMAFSPEQQWLAVGTDAHVQLWNLKQLRNHLRAFGLDWGQPSASPRTLREPSRLFERAILGAVLGGVLVALVLMLFVRHKHQRLLHAYLSVDALMEQRNAQLAQTQADLFQSQKMKALGTLAAGIAHDFNNLLSVIRMANKLTGEAAGGHADIQQNVGLVERTVAQGKAVVRSMLGYSRTPGEKGPYSVHEVVEGTVAMLHKQFLSGIDLKLALSHSAPTVEGIRNRLEQILLNLLVNSSEAMGGKGQLRITVTPELPSKETNWVLPPRASASFVQVILQDSGPGMTPEVRERAFEPFFTTKTIGSQRGTGLGLSMVYTLAQDEGYGLALDTVPGQGCTFRIVIPSR